MKGQKILITGGAGAIGSNLARELCVNNEVTVLDDLSGGYLENIVPIMKRVKFVKGSILNDGILNRLAKSEYDYVFHLAAFFANQRSIEFPIKDSKVNVVGTVNMLEFARKVGAKRFVYAGSASSYHKTKVIITEKTEITPSTPYSLSKYIGERYCLLYNELYGLDSTVIRYSNSFGPGEYPGKYRNVIPNFFMHAVRGEPLPVTGTGGETRTFTYIDDVIKGTVMASESKSAVGEVFNISSGMDIDINTLAGKINRITGNKAGTIHVKQRSWDKCRKRHISNSKARSILGFKPSVSLDEGLRKTYSWFLGLKNAEGK